MRALAAAALLSCFTACTPSFESVSEVRDLRVLAISAEPPEAFVDQSTLTVQTVHVRVLVADPAPRAGVDATAALCFPSDNRLCGDQKLDLPAQHGNVGELAFDVKASPTLSVLIVSALQDDKLKGLGGIRVQFSTRVADGDPRGPIDASKTLLYSSVPPEKANHSPRIAMLQILRANGSTEQLLEGQSLNLDRFEEVGLRPVLGAGQEGAESYTTTDLSGHSVDLTEQPAYSFFTTLGAEYDRDTATEPVSTQSPGFGLTRFRSLKGGNGQLWVVVRDGRGGENWLNAGWSSN